MFFVRVTNKGLTLDAASSLAGGRTGVGRFSARCAEFALETGEDVRDTIVGRLEGSKAERLDGETGRRSDAERAKKEWGKEE